jgi:hypothetical protein
LLQLKKEAAELCKEAIPIWRLKLRGRGQKKGSLTAIRTRSRGAREEEASRVKIWLVLRVFKNAYSRDQHCRDALGL